ncbi:MAG TPA: hypothetical protein VFQ38_18330 [Longimicrobiales bacterium]|nr:hypothetical protein [Longimicrobiales bacterium]
MRKRLIVAFAILAWLVALVAATYGDRPAEGWGQAVLRAAIIAVGILPLVVAAWAEA